MRRGDVVLVADKAGDYSSKPRPALVVQSDLYNDTHSSLTICPVTTHLIGADLFRLQVRKDADNGLLEDSEIQIDKLQSVKRVRIGRRVGSMSPLIMQRVDNALRHWLNI